MLAPMLDDLMRQHRVLDEFLRKSDQLALAIGVEGVFKKVFVLACGSFCEQQVMELVERFVDRHGNKKLTEFVRARALERSYHSMFSWKDNNSNPFWGFFGSDIKKTVLDRMKHNPQLKAAERAFFRLGNLRNQIAHEFESAYVDLTLDELDALKDTALQFLDLIEEQLDKMAPIHLPEPQSLPAS